MIKIKTFTFNPFQENTYVLSEPSGSAVVIDPGCYEKEEREQLLEYVKENNLKVELLLNTHCHVDHVLGNRFVKEYFQVPLLIPIDEVQVLRSVKAFASIYGFHAYEECEPDRLLSEHDRISFGNANLNILLVPGHSPGHMAFYNEEDKICMGGDVLFYGSIGRYDLPGGSLDVLMTSIKDKMFSLPDDTTIYPGHGRTTTIGAEKKNNPYCAI